MHFVIREFQRFLWWVQQGGNSNLILVAITTWYVFLTQRILFWSTLETREQMRPNLTINVKEGHNQTGLIEIENAGKYGVNVCDVLLTYYSNGQISANERFDEFQGAQVPPSKKITFEFPLPDYARLQTDANLSYTLRVVASDNSKNIFMTYDYRSREHVMLTSNRKPLFIAIRMWAAPIRMRWHRIRNVGKNR